MAGKENLKRVYKYYGIDDYGFSIIQAKISGLWLTKLIHGPDSACCEICFRVDVHCKTNRKRVIKKSWKRYRKHQYK